MLLKVSQCVCVCIVVFVCVTSGAAFLFCSLTPRFSRLRLASKHSGHTRLVLLSKVFEHFAQMACRRTELLTVNCPKEIYHLFPPWLLSASLHFYILSNAAKISPVPSVLTAPQDLQWCLRLVKLKLSLQPLHVCFSLSFFLELFWKNNNKNNNKHKSCVKVFSLFRFSTTEQNGMSDDSPRFIHSFFFFLSINTDKDRHPPTHTLKHKWRSDGRIHSNAGCQISIIDALWDKEWN